MPDIKIKSYQACKETGKYNISKGEKAIGRTDQEMARVLKLIDRDIKAATINRYTTCVQEDRHKHVKERHRKHKKDKR